jgi:hypothetical protein
MHCWPVFPAHRAPPQGTAGPEDELEFVAPEDALTHADRLHLITHHVAVWLSSDGIPKEDLLFVDDNIT